MSQIHYTTYRLDTGPNPVAATKNFHHLAVCSSRNCAKVELVSRIPGHSLVGSTLDVYRPVTEGEIKAEHAKYGPLGEDESSASA